MIFGYARVSTPQQSLDEQIEKLRRAGADITVNVLNMGRLDDSAGGKLMRNVVLAFAEFERDMIVTRTQEGKKYAKLHNKNYREGRPKRVITPKYRMIYEYKTSGHSYTETAKAFEISKSTIQRIVKQVESEEQ